MNKKIAILCRGKSLQYLHKLPEFDEYIIVNKFDEELKRSDIIDKLGDKPITHVVGYSPTLTGNMISNNCYKDFNIQKIVVPYVREYTQDKSLTIEGRDGIIPVESLSDNVKKHMWTPDIDPRPDWHHKKEFDLPTTGMAAICHASIDREFDDIYIIGMDFYDGWDKSINGFKKGSGYAYNTDLNQDGSQETEPMKQFLTENITEKLSNKTFHLYTLGNYQSNLKNMNVVNLNKRKIAVVAGGWHFPNHFYEEMIKQEIPDNWEVNYFCVSHRNPDLEVVYDEKKKLLTEYCGDENNIFNVLDNHLYEKPITIQEIKDLGWNYVEKPNVMGDFNFINQWMEDNNLEDYDAILSTHDDNFIFRHDLFTEGILQYDWNEWLTIANGADIVPGNVSNMRGSFAMFKTSLISKMGGEFSTENVTMTREGEVETPFQDWMSDGSISDWNHIAANFGEYVKQNNLSSKVKRLSNQYRISPYCFEGERGFLSRGGNDQMPNIFKYFQDNFEVEDE